MRSTYIYACKARWGKESHVCPPSLLRSMVLLWAHTAASPITHSPTHATLPSSSFLPGLFHPSKLHLLRLPCLEAGTQWRSLNSSTVFSGAISPRRSQGPSLLAGWDSLVSVQCERVCCTCTQIRQAAQCCEERSPGPAQSCSLRSTPLGWPMSPLCRSVQNFIQLISSQQPLGRRLRRLAALQLYPWGLKMEPSITAWTLGKAFQRLHS